jgi:hypothetical protein
MTIGVRVMLTAALLLLVSSVDVVPLRAAENYEALVARLKAGDLKVDFGALRDAYAESTGYAPYGGSFDAARQDMIKAANAHDCKTSLANAEKVLDAIYIDILSHTLSARCYQSDGDSAKAEFHRSVARGLYDAIVATGDGKTPKTAFAVVTINEEYDVLGIRDLDLETQSLVYNDGHAYDAMKAKSESGEEMTLYFQIDRPMQWMDKSLSPK